MDGINQLVRVNQQHLEMQRIKAALKEFRNDPVVCSELRKQLLSSCRTEVTVPDVPPTIECNPLAATDNDEVSLEGNSGEAESAII